MRDLTLWDIELVALGAATGSNCIPCIEHHIGAARAAGLPDELIHAAIDIADKVRQMARQKLREAALRSLEAAATPARDCGCTGIGTAPRTCC